jgi:hypothetical protein
VRTLYGKVTALGYLVIWPVTLLGGILIAAFRQNLVSEHLARQNLRAGRDRCGEVLN